MIPRSGDRTTIHYVAWGGYNIMRTLSLLFLGVLLTVLVIGCRSDGPLSPQSGPEATPEPDFIKMPANLSLHKVVTDEALITPERGGELKLEFKYKYTTSAGTQRDLNVKMRLTFPAGAVDDSVVARMSLDDEVLRSSVDITFNPHGAMFRRPAILDAEVRGMDMAGFNPHQRIWLYYDDNGTWVKMVAKKIAFDYKDGLIKCDDGELPHFSRYAFGR